MDRSHADILIYSVDFVHMSLL